MKGIRPANMPAFDQLIERINAAHLGRTFSTGDWDEIGANMHRSIPQWYRELLVTYPLGAVKFIVPRDAFAPPESAPPEFPPLPWSCYILCPGALKNYSCDDYFFVNDFFPQWLQFGEAYHFGGPGRWLLPIDENAEPIVHRFSDGDAAPVSTGRAFDDFLLTASLDEPERK